MPLPRRLVSRTFVAIALSVVVYAAVAVFVGWDDLRGRLAVFPAAWLLPLALLSAFNYALRYWRWEVYLRALGVHLPWRDSLGLYFATYLMVITPGKIGEVFKAGVLRERFGVRLALGLPIVLAERIFDFLAVLVLAGAGVATWPGPLAGVGPALAAAAAIPLLLALFQWRPVRLKLVQRVSTSPLLGRHDVGLDEASNALSRLLGLRLGTWSLFVTTVAWAAECVGLWLVCRGLEAPVPVGQAGFVYAAGTLVGSLSFLPGGLGGTEASIIWLLEQLDVSRTAAGSAAVLIRLFTLWLAVVVGFVFFIAHRRLFVGAPDDTTRPDEGGPVS